MRLLFVTADPIRPKAVASALLARGYDWQVLACSSSSNAREALAAQPVDALVVDLELPEAEALLRHALRTSPGTARSLVSASGHEDAAIRLLALVHGLLVADDDVDAIAEAVAGHVALVQGLEQPGLREAVGALTRLPGMPKLYLAIRRALKNPNTDAITIVTMLQDDPVVSARVLQLANSALFGGSRGIASVPYAVTRLGLKTIQQLVLAAEVYATDSDDTPGAKPLLQSSLLAAWLAPRLQAPLLDPELAATAALLAGLGPLLGLMGLDAVQRDPDEPPVCDLAAAYLLGLWQLPSSLQQAVAWQRCPRRAGGRFGVVGAVHVATALAFDRRVDTAWLERCGVAAHLSGWRELGKRIVREAG